MTESKPDVFEIDAKTEEFLWSKLDDLEDECFKELEEHENLLSMDKLDVALALTKIGMEKMYTIFDMLASDERFEEDYKWDDLDDRVSMYEHIEAKARAYMALRQLDYVLQLYYGHKIVDDNT